MRNPLKPKILFLQNDSGSFIDRDREILQELGELTIFDLRGQPSLLTSILSFAKSCHESTIIFVWFGSLEFLPYLLLAKILKKKIFIVCGGHDVAYAPEIQHGAFTQNSLRRFLRRFLFRLAYRVLAVSAFNQQEALTNARIPKDRLRLIPLGFPPLNQQKSLPVEKRKNQVVMIAHLDPKSVVNKGLHHLLQLARMNPQIQFCHLGRISEEVQRDYLKDHPLNLKFLGEIPYRSQEFNQVLNESKVILQLSFYESFCASLIDGAMTGCYPIAWSRTAMPETIKGLGETVDYGDLEGMSERIQPCMSQKWDPQALAEKAYQKYSLEKRMQKIREEIL
jgi:glycosyltransferase involved in cell wall biosynthesis